MKMQPNDKLQPGIYRQGGTVFCHKCGPVRIKVITVLMDVWKFSEMKEMVTSYAAWLHQRNHKKRRIIIWAPTANPEEN